MKAQPDEAAAARYIKAPGWTLPYVTICLGGYGFICRSCAASRRSPKLRRAGCAVNRGSKPLGSTWNARALWSNMKSSREAFLQFILAQLRGASLKDVAALVHASNGAANEPPRSPASALQTPATQSDIKNSNVAPTKSEVPGLWSAQSPLALPTLSLGLAFSANPFVIALNMPLMLWNGVPDRAAGLARVEPGKAPECRFSRYAGDHAPPLPRAIRSPARIVTWLIKLGDWIRDLTAAGLASARSANCWSSSPRSPG